MEFMFNLSGNNIPLIKEFDVAAETALVSGEAVGLLEDKVVKADDCQLVLGICAEDHSGKEDILNSRSNGTRVRVIISPNAVYGACAVEYTALSGTDTTLTVSSEGLSVGVNSGYAMLVKKAQNSANTDRIGSKRRISGCEISGESATLTLESGSAPSAGDVYVIIPTVGTELYSDEAGTGVCLYRQASKAKYTFVCTDSTGKLLYSRLDGTVFA